MSTASQLVVVFQMSKSTGGPLFTILCLAKPLASTMYGRTLWDKGTLFLSVCHHFKYIKPYTVSLAVVTNAFHIRMKALETFMADKFRQDVINGNLEQYILSGKVFPQYMPIRLTQWLQKNIKRRIKSSEMNQMNIR